MSVSLVALFNPQNGEIETILIQATNLDCDSPTARLTLGSVNGPVIFVDLPIDPNGTTQFDATGISELKCNDPVFLNVFCEEKEIFELRTDLPCKPGHANDCPNDGPGINVVPGFEPGGCIPAGNYSLTTNSSEEWPDDTQYIWFTQEQGQEQPTLVAVGQSYVHTANPADLETTITVVATAPGCDPRISTVTLPAVPASGDCPDEVTFSYIGPDGVERTVTGSQGQDITIDDLSPGTYTFNILEPNEYDDVTWFNSGSEISNSITLSETDDIVLEVTIDFSCCASMLFEITLSLEEGMMPPVGGEDDPVDTSDNGVADTTDDDTTTNDPTNRPSPFDWCLLLCVVVVFGLVILLAGILVGTATSPGNAIHYAGGLSASIVAILLATALLLLCNSSPCALLRKITWSLKWAVTIGAVISLVTLNPAVFLLTISLGVVTGLLIVWISFLRGCVEPNMLEFVC